MGFYGRISADVEIGELDENKVKELKKEIEDEFGEINHEDEFTISIIWEDDLPFGIFEEWEEFFNKIHKKYGVKVFLYLWNFEEPTSELIIGDDEDDEEL